MTPVFNDYSKHLKELDEKYGENKSIQKTLSVHTEAKASILKTPENCHVSSATSKENIISSTPIQKEGAPSGNYLYCHIFIKSKTNNNK